MIKMLAEEFLFSGPLRADCIFLGDLMDVGVGFSELPDSAAAGRQAVLEAMRQTCRSETCDLALLFATARHDAVLLREAVASVVGPSVPIVGGGAVGAITNQHFGYAGDQIGIALFWFQGARCDLVTQGGLDSDEEAAGERLGHKLARLGTAPDSPVLLFYDAVDMACGYPRLIMATHLLRGMEKALGFLPDLNGAGLQGDHQCSPVPQWTGKGTATHHALALRFGGDVRVDAAIMHGCRPATGYYTVTRADRQTILEINERPALDFMRDLLGPAVPPESYPFFLLLGVNQGDRWGAFQEENYASRLCLGLDAERGGLVMFEPDMVEGTEFQIMYRSLDLDYMVPRIEQTFSGLNGRRPVFALYIDCAGRAAGYGGVDMEDALVVQKTVDGRVPLLGIYTGVEIASVRGRPRGLDWTGVFCLFSVPHE